MDEAKWVVVSVLGRPSASTRDFFNSIKFYSEDVTAATRSEALNLGGLRHGYAEWRAEHLSGGYELLNWYAFPK